MCEQTYVKKSLIFLLFTLIFFSIFFPIVSSPSFQVSEAREGVVVEELLATNQWILPLRNGSIVPSKPIFFHWISAALSIFSSHPSELALRLPSAVAAFWFLIFGFVKLKKNLGSGAALFFVAILSSTYGFQRLAQDGRVDMLFSVLSSAALLCWMEYLLAGDKDKKRFQSFALCSIFLGFAVMTKGPLGLALPGLVMGSSLLFFRKKDLFRAAFRWEWLLMFCIFVPWYYLAAQIGGESFIARQIFFENIERFQGGTGIIAKEPWFYFVHFLGHGAPWSIIFIIYLIFLLRNRIRNMQKRIDLLPTDPKERKAAIYSLLWFGLGFVLFSVSAGKRRAYLLPLLPAMALLLSVRFAATLEQLKSMQLFDRSRMRFGYVSMNIVILFTCLLIGIPFAFLALEQSTQLTSVLPPAFQQFLADAEEAVLWMPLYWLLLLLFPLGIALGSLWFVYKKREVQYFGIAVFALLLSVFSFHIPFAVAVKAKSHTYKWFAEKVRKNIPEDLPIYAIKTIPDESYDVFFYYFGRRVELHNPDAEITKPGIYLYRKNESTAEIESKVKTLFSGKRESDDADETIIVGMVK
jgi:4-amino-4-deoxy-L-arabinose transferase-like glycosyltransferase